MEKTNKKKFGMIDEIRFLQAMAFDLSSHIRVLDKRIAQLKEENQKCKGVES